MTREARMTNFEPDSIHFQNFTMIFSHLAFGFHWALGIGYSHIRHYRIRKGPYLSAIRVRGLVRAGYFIFIDKVHLQGVHPESSQ